MFEKIKKLFNKKNEAYAIDSQGNKIEVEILPANWSPEKERKYQQQKIIEEYQNAQKEKTKQIFMKETLPILLKQFLKIFLYAFILPMTITFISKIFGFKISYFGAIVLFLIFKNLIKSIYLQVKH